MLIESTTITCSKAPQVTENEDGTFSVILFDPNILDMLDGFAVEDIIDYFDENEILESIGEDAAATKFNLYTETAYAALEEELEEAQRKNDDTGHYDEYKEIMADRKAYIQFEESKKGGTTKNDKP